MLQIHSEIATLYFIILGPTNTLCFQGMMDCLYAKCIPYVTECVQGELERLGERYRLALKVIKDARIERLPCLHKGIYADDCLVQRVTQVTFKISSYR